jgi:hypothetical protein
MAQLTTSFFINQANSFVSEVQNTRNSYYIFAGRSQAWPDDQNPPSTADSLEQTELTVYNELLFGKLIDTSDVQLLVPRYDWTINTVYAMYDQTDSDLFSKQFFVVNDQFQVYKCIFNNFDSPSTVQPRLASSSGTFNTSDGYIWKYMFTVDAQANTKFTDSFYIPVTTDAEVSGNAIPGTIDAYKLTNGGSGYRAYESGFLFSVIDPFTIQLPSTSSSNDNFYTRSSIYLRSGFGAGQIREITSYNGATKQLRVSTQTPLETFKRLDFVTQPVGTIALGYFAEQQFSRISYLFISNNQFFTTGGSVVQSDTGAQGTVLSANSSIIRVDVASVNTFVLSLPIRDASQDGTVRNGTVSIVSGNTTVTGTNTAFTNTTTGYTVGSYIRVGNNVNSQIRRVNNITNNTVLSVSNPFATTLVSNAHFLVPIAAEPSSITIGRATGTVSNTNLNSLKFDIVNTAISGLNFILGEQVTQVDNANTYLGANGIVAFANTTTLFLSGVTGAWSQNQFVLGASSLQKSQIDVITNNPNVTLRDPVGDFIQGFPVNFRLNSLSPTVTANGTLLSVVTIPNDQTEYLIAPTVKVTGDGTNARAIAVVNSQFNSLNEITAIEVIDPGTKYTSANVEIYANNSFGSNATATAIISPVDGHGQNPPYELGSRFVGVATIFDDGITEGYVFPTSGSYRRIGILENPEYADVKVTLDNFDRVNLQITNKSTVSSNVSITNWVPGEVVIQPSTNAAGLVVIGNNTFVQIKNVLGTFAESNAAISGVFSNTSANVVSADIIRFQVTSDSPAEIISKVSSGAKGEVVQLISNTEVLLSNVVGKFVANDVMFDASVNAFATVVSISTANGTRDVTSSFGIRFDQTLRFTLSSNTGSFANNERVVQTLTNATGLIISDRSDIDLGITLSSGSFSTGQIVTSNSGANAFVTFANATYLKLTGITPNTNFVTGDLINNGLGANASIDATFPVLVLGDIGGINKFQPGNDSIVIGQSNGAQGICNSSLLIQYPDLVRDSGKVLYIDNVEPIERTTTSREDVRLVIRF